MSYPTFSAQARSEFGTRPAKRFRAAGKVPVSISRKGDESVHALVEEKVAFELADLLSCVAILSIDGQEHEILVKQIERDPVHDRLWQIDTVAVSDDRPVKVDVAVRPDLNVDCPGLKAGGLLEQMLRRVRISCRPQDIPEALNVDLRGVDIGQTLYAENVDLPEGAKLLTKPRTALLTIIKTRGMRRAEGGLPLDGEEGEEGEEGADGEASAEGEQAEAGEEAKAEG